MALADALQKPALKRQQFETTEEFEARAEKLLADARRITGPGSFKFTVPVPADQIMADVKMGLLTVVPAAISSGLVPTMIGNGNRIIVVRSMRTVGAIPSETAFSGRRLVAKEEETVLAVSARGGDYLRWPRGFNGVKFRIEQEVVRRSKKKDSNYYNLAVLFTARLQSPYLTQEITRQSPRLDFPHDVTTHITTIAVQLECAALINRSNNVTLQPIDLGP